MGLPYTYNQMDLEHKYEFLVKQIEAMGLDGEAVQRHFIYYHLFMDTNQTHTVKPQQATYEHPWLKRYGRSAK